MRHLRYKEDQLLQAYESSGDLYMTLGFPGEEHSHCPDEVSLDQWRDMVENPERYIVTTVSGKLTIKNVEENQSHGSDGS